MSNPIKLVTGQRYVVVREFTDFDLDLHPVGEKWVFQGTNFLPYDDGLTLHVTKNGFYTVYRLQWRPEEQGGIIEHFAEYVAAVE